MNIFRYDAFKLGVAADVSGGTLTGVKLGLTKSALDISGDRVLADFVTAKATFTSYVKTVLTWHDPSRSDDGQIEIVSDPITFRPTDGVNPNGIWDFWIEDATAALLYCAGQFDAAPLPMNSALDELVIVVRWRPDTGFVVVVVS